MALERIAWDLSTDVTDLQWVVNAYTLSFASLLLTGGTLGDRWGIRRVYMPGLCLWLAVGMTCVAAAVIALTLPDQATIKPAQR